MDFVASGTPYTFQQDSAPAHKAKLVHFWLKKNVPNFWGINTCPPNSSDLNPCVYYL
ncbi:Transposable element tcb1 transposase [Caligus rogercresseyi]|uniref:Transposable element tcb1 transposase n=1 Tax=Caligus rogercresseyi TaxID=217165 RepID=A0A7T8K8L9_CALRO|nr:Transposable element tcb1 transposase [Caligus rogercresseyi]